LIVFGLTITVALKLPQLFGAKLGENTQQAQWVVFFLGVSIALEMSLAVFSGVLTGCHRWGLHNFIKSGCHIVTIAVMIIALLKGGGLRSLAVANFAGQVLENSARVILAYRICEGLQVRLSLVRREVVKQLFVFGGKTLIPSVSNLLLNQTTSILIVAYLGPAALALYSRPLSLMNHINTLVGKMSFVLTPTISSLQSTNNTKEIRELLLTSVRYSSYMVLPVVLVLVVFGDAVMQFWMGQRYANGLLPMILALGYLVVFVQQPVWNILWGLNTHGRAGIAQFVASLCSAALTVLALGYLKLGIVGVAVTVTLPLAIMNVVYLPSLICRRVDLSIRKYFLSVTVGPAVHVLPFAICLIAGRVFFHNEPLKGLLWGGLAGSVFLTVLYHRYVLPERIKMRVIRLVSLRRSVV